MDGGQAESKPETHVAGEKAHEKDMFHTLHVNGNYFFGLLQSGAAFGPLSGARVLSSMRHEGKSADFSHKWQHLLYGYRQPAAPKGKGWSQSH